jgi:HlyD family secretion protein
VNHLLVKCVERFIKLGLQVTQQQVSSGTPGENLDRRIIEVRIRFTPEDSQRVAALTNLQVQVAIKL